MSVQLFHHQSALATKIDILVPCVSAPGIRPNDHATYDSAIAVKATATSTLSLGLRRLSPPPVPVERCGTTETSSSSSVSSPSSHTIMYSPEAGLRLIGSDGLAFTARSIIDGGPLTITVNLAPFPSDG